MRRHESHALKIHTIGLPREWVEKLGESVMLVTSIPPAM
jgi:hypothetical protein